MREHGLFERILLIYDDTVRRLKNKTELDLVTLAGTVKIVRSFIEDYHSKLEDDQVFPRFEKAGKLVELVKLLHEQHQAGRKLTDQILQLAVPNKTLDEANSQKLLTALGQFIRMYRPHLAREDTVLFPAMHAITTPEDYDVMGDEFEDLEHKLFGEHGFENVVEQVAGLEKTLGIYELSEIHPQGVKAGDFRLEPATLRSVQFINQLIERFVGFHEWLRILRGGCQCSSRCPRRRPAR